MTKLVLRNLGVVVLIGFVVSGVVYLGGLFMYLLTEYFGASDNVSISVMAVFFLTGLVVVLTIDMERFHRNLDERYPSQPPKSQKYKDNPEKLEQFMTDFDRRLIKDRERIDLWTSRTK